MYYISPHHKLGWKWRRGAIINVLLCLNHELRSYMHISMFLHDIWRFIFSVPKKCPLQKQLRGLVWHSCVRKSIAILHLTYLYKIHKGTFISYLLATEGYPDSQEFVLVVYLSMLFWCLYSINTKIGHLKTLTSVFFFD